MTIKQSDQFCGPRLKIDRAKRHIRELNNDIIDYIKLKPYRVVVEQDPNSANQLWTLRVRHEVPCHFAAIIGDAVHNLRAALDLLASELVRLKGGNTKNVYFPFCDDVDSLDRMIKDRHIDRAGEDIVEIIRSLKPYHGGNELLRAVHDLDITDKHKTLIPSTHYAGINNFQMRSDFGPMFTMLNMHVGPIKDGQIIMSLPPARNIKIGQYFQPTLKITFGYEQPLQNKPVIETLHQLTQIVTDIINIFEKHISPQQEGTDN